MINLRLPAEWNYKMLYKLHFKSTSDWLVYWDEVVYCYIHIIETIATYQPLIIVCDDVTDLNHYLKKYRPKEYLHY